MKSHLIKLALFCTLLLTLMFSSQAAAPAQAQGTGPFAYIANHHSDTVSVIDTTTNTVVATVFVGTNPYGVAINPTGTRVYVTNYSSNNVSVIDTTNNSVVSTVTVGTNPEGIAINPTGTRAYVVNSNSHNVSVIDISNNSVVQTITVGNSPYGVAINPTGTRVYVTNYIGGNISVIDTSNNSVIATITVGNNPFGVVVNPTGTRVYVANYSSNNVSVIDTNTNSVVSTVTVGSYPRGVAVNPAGTRVYVANYLGNNVSVIDTSNNNVIATMTVGSNPHGVGVNSTGTLIYVTNVYGDNVSVIDTSNNNIIATVAVGSWPYSMGQFIGPVLTAATPTSTPIPPTSTPTPTPTATITSTPTPTFSCSTVTEIPTTECDDLVLLYNSTNGPGWTNKTGWLTTNTPCSWYNVICNTGHVTWLGLYSNQLRGTIPNFSNLPNLTQLELSYNQLSGSIPNFSNMPNLSVLTLQYNQLNGPIPNFSSLPNLTRLYLYNNQLSGPIPNFSNLPNLTQLELTNNQLSGSIPNFTNVPNLMRLDIQGNQLSGNIPNFTNLLNLDTLTLQGNQLSGNIPNFTNLPNLKILYLNSNQLSGTIPNFTNLPNLVNLYLDSNQLSGNIPNFTNAPNLYLLWLQYNQLTGTIPNLNWSNFSSGYLYFNHNCGLVPFDTTQATVLSSKDPNWQQLNPACPTPTPTVTPNNPPTMTATPTNIMPTATPTITATIVMTITPTVTVTEVITITPTMTVTEVITTTPPMTVTETPTITTTPPMTVTETPTITTTPAITVTETPTITVTPTASATATPTPIVTMTPTDTLTPGVTTGVIKGIVLGLGESLPNINVGLYHLDRGWNLVKQTTTDSQGQYQFNDLAPGYYRLGIFDWAKNQYLYEFYPNGLIFEEGRLIKVSAGQIIFHNIEMEKPSRFRGTVRDKQGNPLPNIAVEVMRYSLTVTGPTWSQAGWAYSQADGSYQVSNLRAGQYRLGFMDYRWPRWYPTKYYPDGNTPAEATLVDLTESVTRTGLDVRLDGPGAIHGRVVNGAGKPIEGIYVQSYQANDAQWNWNGQIQTDSNGEYTLTGLNGTYRLAFFDWLTWPPRYKEIYYNNGQDLATATDVMVTINQTTTVNVTLDKVGKIVGQVLNANSEPMANVTVKALRQTFVTTTSTWIWQPVAWAWTDGSGQYRLENLSKGSYRVGFFTSGSFDTLYGYYDEVVTLDNATEVLVTAGATTSGIDYQLPPPAPALVEASSNTGQVEVSPANGQVNIRQGYWQRSDLTISKVVTCANQLTPESVSVQLGNKSYAMVATGEDYAVTIPETDLVELPGSTLNDIKLTVVCSAQPQAQLVGTIFFFYDPSGLITDAVTGQPIAQAKVTLYKVDAWHAKIGPADDSANSCESNLSKVANQVWSQPALTERGILALAETGEFTPTVNPQFTASDGRYRWDVKAGCWYVQVEAEGYETKISPMVGIPPEVTDLNIALTPKAKFRFETVAYTVNRSTGTSYITVTTGLPVKAKATVDYILSDVAGSQLLTGTLTFETGQAQQALTLNLKQLAMRSSIKHYNLTLTHPTGLSLGLNTEALLSVIDDKVAINIYLPLIVK